MSQQFQFLGFNPDDSLKKQAFRALEKLLDMSPYGSMPVAVMEKTSDGYRCAVEIYTRHGPFISESIQSEAGQALSRVRDAIAKKLSRWSHARFISTSDLHYIA